MAFQKATKRQSKLRLNLNGPAGGGKTKSSLKIATALVEGTGKRVAVIDTERGSAAKYANEFDFDVEPIADDYHPQRLMDTVDLAAKAGYGCLVVDSLSHFWNGKGGFLELVDQEVERMRNMGQKADSFAAWKKVTPIYNALIQKLLSFPGHLICTARAKMDYEKQQDDRGKTKVVKLGLAPELRDGWQYEFDVEGMLNDENTLIIGKTRCPDLAGKMFKKPGKDVADILRAWLEDGDVALEPAVVQSAQQPANDVKPGPLDSTPEQRCINEIGAAATLLALESIGAKIAKTPKKFQDAVDPAYVKREAELKAAA